MDGLSVVYYPYFNPPHSWLRKILLFTETVRPIIPQDVDPQFSNNNLDLIGCDPQAILPIQYPDYYFVWDELTFKELKSYVKLRLKYGYTLYGNNSNKSVFMGFYRQKVPEKIINYLIKKKLAERTDNFDIYNVDDCIGNVLVGIIADRMAQVLDYSRTMTSEESSYLAHSGLTNFEKKRKYKKGMLAASIISVSIPKDINSMGIDEYLKYRETWKGVRRTFKGFVDRLADDRDIYDITDKNILQERASKIANDFANEVLYEVIGYNKNTYKEFIPIMLGLGGAVGPFMSNPIMSKLFGGAVSITSGFTSFNQNKDSINYNPHYRKFVRIIAKSRIEAITSKHAWKPSLMPFKR